MGKRKRESNINDSVAGEGAPTSKVQVTEKEDHVAAERRQQRSERKSRKTAQTKGHAFKRKIEPPATNNTTLPASDDFVPLATDAEAAIGSNNVPKTSSQTQEPEKDSARRAPRTKRKEAQAAKAQANISQNAQSNTKPNDELDQNGALETTKAAKASKDARFIVFVGNLPFNTTTAEIQQHFRKLSPTHIRHNTDKKTQKSKGFAFVEFDAYDKMKTALKLYHHSIFDPARTARLEMEAKARGHEEPDLESAIHREALLNGKPSKEGRKINVELTAGGGGKSQKRVERIESKNKKLAEERERRKKEEMRLEKGKQGGRKKESQREVDEAAARKRRNEEEIQAAGMGDVHPSRMKRVRNG